MDIEEIKAQIIPTLKKYEVKRAGIFGSVARGESGPESDVDLLVKLPESSSLLDLAGLQIELQRALKRKVDVLTYDSLYHLLRERILKEAVRIL